MFAAPVALNDKYWEEFELNQEDIEVIYSHLLDVETPLTPDELIEVLVEERIKRKEREAEKKLLSGGDIYLPKERYKTGQSLVFPKLEWARGKVVGTRSGFDPDIGKFEVIKVEFENGEVKEFASVLEDHILNSTSIMPETNLPEASDVIGKYKEFLVSKLEEGLVANDDFVRIAGRWFPKALLISLNDGHLNLAEAVLDMENGGPLPTSKLVAEIELNVDENPKLVEFSLDYALDEDERFDEVGPAGEVLWFLHRLEPDEVRETPLFLKYENIDYDRDVLTDEMIALERELDDELSPDLGIGFVGDAINIKLIYPHIRSGTIPLTPRIKPYFPTSYEAPRIRFTFVDEQTGEKFPAWVVREGNYVYGLKEWYEKHGLFPGSILTIKRNKNSGEVIIAADNKRSNKDWLRTVLVGTDGGLVFAMLKQIIKTSYDDRMAIFVPDEKALDDVWMQTNRKALPFERIVVNIVRELTKLNPQSHVHVTELYSAINLIRRCPPGPIMALLASRPWFSHVGDLHFRFSDSELNLG